MSITNSRIRLTAGSRRTRAAAVAGTFYPANPAELTQVVKNLLNAAKVDAGVPKALIVPHAGYIYSGPAAAQAYACLHNIRQGIKRVILLGPAHRVYVNGMALPTATVFATPLGEVLIDRQAVNQIKHLAFVHMFDDAHAQEHSLEVQLPFLQMSLESFTLLPLVVGEAGPEQVARVLDILWGGDETLIVISSDLSHYHDYARARQIDDATAKAVENLRFEQIEPDQACGCRPVNGLLLVARQQGMKVNRLSLCNSGDTAGNRDRVVGYGAWSLHEIHMLGEDQRQLLLNIARQSIERGLRDQHPLEAEPSDYTGELRELRACFVTLKINNQLRGCIGTTEAIHPLVTGIAESAFNAAFRDPRFPPLSTDEYRDIDLSISVLTPQQVIPFSTETELLEALRPGKDGLTISKGQHKATFLPAVWESITEADSFLSQLKLKAGMDVNEQPDCAWRYTAESFS